MKKSHWTQTKAGRAKMAKLARQRHRQRALHKTPKGGNREQEAHFAYTFGWITCWLEANREAIARTPTFAASPLGAFVLSKKVG
jgi:hypothetical protein